MMSRKLRRYFTCYICRKPASVAKDGLHKDKGVSVGFLGLLDTCNLLCYSCGQFVMGRAGDRFGARFVLGWGMAMIAATTAAFGVACAAWHPSSSSSSSGLGRPPMEALLLVVWGISGFFQACGTPGCMKGMAPWFADSVRGSVMGVWNTSYMLGDVVGLLLATAVEASLTWEATFWVAGAIAGVVAVALLLCVDNDPRDVGLEIDVATGGLKDRAAGLGALQSPLLASAEQSSEASSARDDAAAAISIRDALALPGVLLLCLSCFFTEFVRYALLLWLPLYLKKEIVSSSALANLLSTAFSIGGFLGVLAAGYASDRLGPSRRVVVVFAWFLGLIATLAVYALCLAGPLAVPSGAVPAVATGLIALAGFFIAGPDSLLTGTMAMELGGARAAATVTGTINGMGHFGAASQGVIVPLWTSHCGWKSLFLLFEIAAVAGALCVVPLLRRPGREAA